MTCAVLAGFDFIGQDAQGFRNVKRGEVLRELNDVECHAALRVIAISGRLARTRAEASGVLDFVIRIIHKKKRRTTARRSLQTC